MSPRLLRAGSRRAGGTFTFATTARRYEREGSTLGLLLDYLPLFCEGEGEYPAAVSQKSPSSPLPKFPADALVFIVDDDESILRSLGRLFRSVRLASEAYASATAFLERAPYPGPCCVVLDVCMPGLDGLELQQALADRETQVVFLTGHGDVPMCADAMKAGAIDFLIKPVDDERLLDAVGRALERSTGICKTRSERTAARARLDTLTPREFEVMQHVIAGLLNKQIAEELGAAEKTIKIHRGRLMTKMGVASVADLVRLSQAANVAPVA